jgi:hypothetical protein
MLGCGSVEEKPDTTSVITFYWILLISGGCVVQVVFNSSNFSSPPLDPICYGEFNRG